VPEILEEQEEDQDFVLITKLKDDGYINEETVKSLIQETKETKHQKKRFLSEKR